MFLNKFDLLKAGTKLGKALNS